MGGRAHHGGTVPILLHPTGPGESREIPNGQHILVEAITWLPDGKRLVAFGSTPTERSRGWVLDAGDGAARPFTEEGVSFDSSMPVVSPDGSRVVGRDDGGHSRLYAVEGGPSEPVPGLAGGDRVFQWAEDGRALFVGRRAGPAWHILRLDLQTGREARWTEITPRETAGLRLSWVYLTPNGRSGPTATRASSPTSTSRRVSAEHFPRAPAVPTLEPRKR